MVECHHNFTDLDCVWKLKLSSSPAERLPAESLSLRLGWGHLTLKNHQPHQTCLKKHPKHHRVKKHVLPHQFPPLDASLTLGGFSTAVYRCTLHPPNRTQTCESTERPGTGLEHTDGPSKPPGRTWLIDTLGNVQTMWENCLQFKESCKHCSGRVKKKMKKQEDFNINTVHAGKYPKKN